MSKPAKLPIKLPMKGVTVREILKTMIPPVRLPPLTARERKVLARVIKTTPRKLESFCEGCGKFFPWGTTKLAGALNHRLELCPKCIKKLGNSPADSDEYKTSDVI